MIDQAAVSKYVYPAQRPNNVTDPEWQHEQQHEQGLESRTGLIKKVSRNVAEYHAQHHTLQRDAQSAKQHWGVKKVGKEFFIIAQLKGGDVCSGDRSDPEAVNDDETDWDDKKEEYHT